MTDTPKLPRTHRFLRLFQWTAWVCLPLLVLLATGLAVIIAPDLTRPLSEPPDISPLLAQTAEPAATPPGTRPVGTRKSPTHSDALSPTPTRPHTSPPTTRSRTKPPSPFETIIHSTRRMPDLNSVPADLRPAAADWNKRSDALTSAVLALLAESPPPTYAEIAKRMAPLEEASRLDGLKYGPIFPHYSASAIHSFDELVGLAYMRAAATQDEWINAGVRNMILSRNCAYYCWRKAGFDGYARIGLLSFDEWRVYNIAPIAKALRQGKSPVQAWRQKRRDWREDITFESKQEQLIRKAWGLSN